MKKSIIIAAISAASAILLAASCQKQNVPELKSEGKTFTAVINQELTKTTITSEYKVNWEAGDRIDINNGSIFTATPDASDATRASFTKVSGSDPDGEYGYTAVYPASIIVNSEPTLPATQIYAEGKFNAPMCAMSDTESLEFKNFCGVLCFALKGTDKVRSIAVTANEQLCGPFEFIDATAFCFTGEHQGYTVTLDCGTEGIQLNEATATNFYIYLPPCVYTKGMKMTVTNTDGVKFEKSTTKSAKIDRSNIYTFNWTPTFAPVLPDGALPGVFSISDTKKVYFSKGNLYYDGSDFYFETNQDDYPTTWSASHVGHFYWSKTAEEAVKEVFNWEQNFSTDDIFFTNATETTAKPDFTVNGMAGKYRTLSMEEWEYLLNSRTVNGGTGAGQAFSYITYNKKLGFVLYPDNYTGSVLSGTVETLPQGVVFLPNAGGRGYSNVEWFNTEGNYWSSSKPVFSENISSWAAYKVTLMEGWLYISKEYDDAVYLDYGSSIRLVTDVE